MGETIPTSDAATSYGTPLLKDSRLMRVGYDKAIREVLEWVELHEYSPPDHCPVCIAAELEAKLQAMLEEAGRVELCEAPKVVMQDRGQGEVISCTRAKGHSGPHAYNGLEPELCGCETCGNCDKKNSPGLDQSAGVFHGDGPAWKCLANCGPRFLNFREDGSSEWVPRTCSKYIPNKE